MASPLFFRSGQTVPLLARMRDLRIATRLHLVNLVALLGVAAICIYAGYGTRSSLLSERHRALGQSMDIAARTVGHFVELERRGVLSREEAQRQALAVVHEMHYGDGNYFWINQVLDDHRARRLMNGANDALVGTIADQPADAAFLALVRRDGGGTVEQHWPRPGTTQPVPKLSAVRGVKEWNWVIGSGLYLDDISSAFWSAMLRLGGIFLAIWVVLTAAALAITRSVLAPLGQATAVATAIGQGRLDNAIRVTSRNELGVLLSGMEAMQGQLRAMMDAQREMAQQHDAGMISYRMDDGAFPGEYGDIVRGINALVGSHVDSTLNLVGLMDRYAEGDLSGDLEQYPGEKAVLSRTMAKIKASLGAINGEIEQLARAVAAGDFSRRGDTTRFQHEFRAMVQGLNTMIETTDRNLEQIAQVLRRIAAGDLSARMQGEYHGVFASMRDDADATVAQLTAIVARIQQASGHVDTAAGEIAAGNEDLSRRTEQQAANLEETAASMEELTSTVRQNAEHARQADIAANEAGQAVQEVSQSIDAVARMMEQIDASSSRIAEITGVIDGIAFQTNILALNAAVEAARAGEQGRGFAVVASEVRTLAQRCATAAHEIKQLVESAGERVAAGLTTSQASEQAIARLITAAGRTTSLINEIAAASGEQAAGIEQVNQTITQMDEVTQQNAALVEEATAAARSLEQQAAGLTGAVAVFRLS